MDLVNDVFFHLPVKSLVRFKCLSKPCCSLIEGEDFVKSHLDLSVKSGAGRSVLLRGHLHLYSVDLRSLDTAKEIEHPLKPRGPAEVFGSCNGLIALSNSMSELALYNPSTRKLHRLPVSPVEHPAGGGIRGYIFYGFGYDSVNDDYKVVRMVQFRRDEDDDIGCFFPYEVKVYSLRTDSWKRVETSPFQLQFLFNFYYHLMFRRGYGVLACNNLHWVMPRSHELGNRNVIFGFDLAAELFHIVPVPDYDADHSPEFQMDLGTLNDCLCVICNYGQAYVDVWVMKEYGVKESWVKLFIVPRPRSSVGCFSYLRPLIYSDDDDKVLVELDNRRLMWYDLNSRRLRTLRIRGDHGGFSAEMYVASLVSPGEENRADNSRKLEQEKKNNCRNRKNRDDFLSVGFKLVL